MSFSTLISAKDLQRHYDQCLVIDCRFDLADPTSGDRCYRKGHLPHARYAHLDNQLSSKITPESGRHPLPDFNAFHTQIENWGVRDQTQVVAYDDTNGYFAARLWWLLQAIGHENVAVLDGGMQAWTALNGVLETSPIEPTHQTHALKLKRDKWYNIDELQQGKGAGSCVLIDARTEARYLGFEEPIDTIAGHIPGARNLSAAKNLDKNGHFLDAETIRENYQSIIEPFRPANTVHYCGSGVFACFGVLAMEYAGLTGSKIYPGSWSEWIREPARGIATQA